MDGLDKGTSSYAACNFCGVFLHQFRPWDRGYEPVNRMDVGLLCLLNVLTIGSLKIWSFVRRCPTECIYICVLPRNLNK